MDVCLFVLFFKEETIIIVLCDIEVHVTELPHAN